MSHAATNWAVSQRGLKPATKIVLWQLADCHNGHTGQCNPRQSVLADRCEMSRSTVNLHLDKLVKLGLVKRVTSVDPKTKKQRPTHYILAFDAVSENQTRTQDVDEATQDDVEPCPKTGHGAVSEKTEKPCPENEQTRVRKSDTKNLGREPGIEPCVSEAATHTQFEEFWKVHPRPKDYHKSEDAFFEAVDRGEDGGSIIAAAKAYADEQEGNGKQFIRGSDAWLKSQSWTDYAPADQPSPDEIRALAEKFLKSHIPAVREQGRKMLEATQ